MLACAQKDREELSLPIILIATIFPVSLCFLFMLSNSA